MVARTAFSSTPGFGDTIPKKTKKETQKVKIAWTDAKCDC